MGHYVSTTGAVYDPFVVIWATTAAPRCRVPVPKPRTKNELRHTYASLCLEASIRPIDIAELMGHRDVKMTLTFYAHLI